MDTSPQPDTGTGDGRRKSGRVTKAPDFLNQAATVPTKRKRNPQNAFNDSDSGSQSSDDDDDIEAEQGSDTQGRQSKGPRKRPQPPRARQASKRPKPNGLKTELAFRPAAANVRKPKKPRKVQDPNAAKAGGLYADVFGGSKNIEEVAAEWVKYFDQHQANAVRDLVNFVLRCAGCDIQVESQDIEDPDNCPNRLSDIQTEFQARKISEYPLVARNKYGAQFRHNLIHFFDTLIKTIAASDNLLFKEPDLIENIEQWICTMSSASFRAFRHTSTLIALTIISAFSHIAKDLTNKKALLFRQAEGEQRKRNINRARLNGLQQQTNELSEKLLQLDNIIKDWFDTLFLHRYRDVFPQIRVDCAAHLGDWILTYSEHFFDSGHLRYLGWTLSDTHGPTRCEVLRQLTRVFKDQDKISGLGQFIEKFRQRIVEIAVNDPEVSARTNAIELIELLREAGFLEPGDIDTVGKLVYDVDPRIREAVMPFFVANVNESLEVKVDELGGAETLEEVLVDDTVNFEEPSMSWLKCKALVELLISFEVPDEPDPQSHELSRAGGPDAIYLANVDSRVSIAAQAFLPMMEDVQWESLAGYLLFDHTASSRTRTDNPRNQVLTQCKLDEREETVLLDVLNKAVMKSLAEVSEESKQDKKARRTKAQQQDLQERQENAAQQLALLIPKLLNKFSALPEAASAVLRLERVLNLDIFQELRQDSTTYSALLDDINKQFFTHEDPHVLAEAKAALQHAQSFEELRDVTEGKLEALWEDTMVQLINISPLDQLSLRGEINQTTLSALNKCVLRIANLASISDCVSAFETERAPKRKKGGRNKSTSQSDESSVEPVHVLTAFIGRGNPITVVESDATKLRNINQLEDELSLHSMNAVYFYILWKFRAFKSTLSTTKEATASFKRGLQDLKQHRDAYATRLVSILSSRRRISADSLREAAVGMLLDLHALFASFAERNVRSDPDVAHSEGLQHALTSNLALTISDDAQQEILKTFTGIERQYAKHANIKLAEADIDDDPEDDDEPEDDEEDSELTSDQQSEQQEKTKLLAEERLCKLAAQIALVCRAGVVAGDDGEDGRRQASVLRKRVLRNKVKLGPNFKEVVAFLEDSGERRKKKTVGGKAKGTGNKVEKSKEIVDDEDEDEPEQNPANGDVDDADEEALREQGLLDENADEEGAEIEAMNVDGAGEGSDESVLGD